MLIAAIPAFIMGAIALIWIGSFVFMIVVSPFAAIILVFSELKDQGKLTLPNYVKHYFERTTFSFIAIIVLVGAGYLAYNFFNESGNHGDTEYEYPGLDNSKSDADDSPGIHEVDGHYKSNGTYVESYMRSNPDSSTSNNLNP